MQKHHDLLKEALDHLEQALDLLDKSGSTVGVDVHVDMAIHRLSSELALPPRAEDEVLLAGD